MSTPLIETTHSRPDKKSSVAGAYNYLNPKV